MLASLVSSLSGDGHDGWMDGWMACYFMSSSIVFQSYQDGQDGWTIMKDYGKWNPEYG